MLRFWVLWCLGFFCGMLGVIPEAHNTKYLAHDVELMHAHAHDLCLMDQVCACAYGSSGGEI